jgi:hypothetical protein
MARSSLARRLSEICSKTASRQAIDNQRGVWCNAHSKHPSKGRCSTTATTGWSSPPARAGWLLQGRSQGLCLVEPLPITNKSVQALAGGVTPRREPSQCRRLREGKMTLLKQSANRLDRLRFEALECKADRSGLVDLHGNRRWQ